MKFQPNRNYVSNDVVYTPEPVVKAMVEFFAPKGTILEPCKGNGAFLKHLPPDTEWCEISEGRDFLTYEGPHKDWIITNPPWSLVRKFLRKGMEVADNVCYLFTVNHVWTKARLRDIREAGFGIKTIATMDTPKEFPQTGFQLGAVHIQKNHAGLIELVDLNPLIKEKDEET